MDQWWRDGVAYEIYPRSFADSDGNGVGDLAGITERLGYVAELGVHAVWLTPFQRSPQVDHGYDVSDYCDVDPLFGDLAAFDELLRVAHGHRLRVIIDLVPNHCSRAHPLFQAALAAGPCSRERARFHFAVGRGPAGAAPPNNWLSVFGGLAWTRIREPDGSLGQWYLHLYAPGQPDWNWRDPRTGAFFDDVVRFWFDRGVDGLRIDVAHGLFKAEGLPDVDGSVTVPRMRLRDNPLACDREEVHEVYRRWRALAEAYSPSRVLIGEVNLASARVARYTRVDELHQAFAFPFLGAPWDARAWQSVINGLLESRIRGAAPVTWVGESHDVVRAPTRYGGGACGTARGRAALLVLLGLPGAAYLYQGQELGLPQVDVPVQARQDPAWSRCGISRDGCRVPLPWRCDQNGTHGFSAMPARSPWLPVPVGWGAYSVEAQQADPTSTWHLCRAALTLRRRLHAQGVLSADDPVDVDANSHGALVIRRAEAITLVVAMGTTSVGLPPGQLLLASGPLTPEGHLPPNTTAWLRC
jgi:alpha-glucosidase